MNTIAHSQTPANHMMAKSSAVTEWYQSVRRELWESRSLYLAPLIVSVLMVLAFLGRTIQLRANVDALVRGSASAREAIWQPYQSASLLMMGVTFITALFYCADALYGERRDRSILFWKSMPVSDTVTVIAKMSVAVIVLPVITIAAVIVVHLSMLLISSCVLAFSGGGVGSLWAHIPLVSMWTALCIHMLAGHGLWYAPAYAWLLLVSARAKRVPLLWAALPPAGIAVAEKIAFNTKHFLMWIQDRIAGGPDQFAPDSTTHLHSADVLSGLTQYVASPGLWFGIALAAVFLAVAIQLRRRNAPI